MNYYNKIKNVMIQNEITNKVKEYSKNKSDLTTYYQVGKLLVEAGKHYGEGIIKEYSIKLKMELNRKYSTTVLKRMRQFYLLIQKGATLSHQLSWSHYSELISLSDISKINYYINSILCNKLSIRELRNKIKNEEYERLDQNTKLKLKNKEKTEVSDFIKNPIIIHNKHSYEMISEKILQKLIMEDIVHFLQEFFTGIEKFL